MIDPGSPTWRAIEAWANDQIEEARRALETPSTTPDLTEQLRGSIYALRALMALRAPKTPPIAKTDSYGT